MTDKTVQPTGRLHLKNVRLSFAQGLFEASTVAGEGKPRYNCGLIVPPDHPQIAEIRAKEKAVATEKWKDKAPGILKMLEKQDKLALHDGDMKPKYDGYPGNFFLSPALQEDAGPPTLRGHVPSIKLSDKELRKMLYSGAWVNASIDLWAQDNQYGQRVNAQLRGIQFYKDGDAFSAGGVADEDEFEEVTDGANAGDFS